MHAKFPLNKNLAAVGAFPEDDVEALSAGRNSAKPLQEARRCMTRTRDANLKLFVNHLEQAVAVERLRASRFLTHLVSHLALQTVRVADAAVDGHVLEREKT